MTQVQDKVLALFQKAGATLVQPDILQPAEVLLDLYGEDIRARAYVTHDPLRGELMLRPDFTVPVVRTHMQNSAEPARYCYAGPVFRQQDFDDTCPSEHTQVGYEVFDRGNSAQIEAEVFTRLCKAVHPTKVESVVGDVGVIVAAVNGLTTSSARKAALRRHIWRPSRFLELLKMFSMPFAYSKPAQGGPSIGLRSDADVAARHSQLQSESSADPIPMAEVSALKKMLDISCPLSQASAILADVAQKISGLENALNDFEARVVAFRAAGLNIDDIMFQASYGLTAMEYYDGFVFGLLRQNTPKKLAVASGGRYDALTKALGAGRSVPAVGGIVRVEFLERVAHD